MASSLLVLPPFLWFALLLPVATENEIISFGYPSNQRFEGSFNSLGDAGIQTKAFQLTPDSSNEDTPFRNKSGRMIYKKPYKFWDWDDSSSPRKVISFSSTFLFNIFPVGNVTVGEGLAFAIFSDSQSIPENSYGEFLGLTNSSLDGNPNNKFFAVEFDTFKQLYDPDNNHVGLNINSVRSTVTRSLSDFNITLARRPAATYRAWVDYDGPLHRIQVYLAWVSGYDPEKYVPPASGYDSKPYVPLLDATIDLSAHIAKESYFGFSGSTGTHIQLNTVFSWNLTVEILLENKPFNWFLKIGVPITVALLLVVACLGFWAYRRPEKAEERLAWTLRSLPGTPREFPYKLLKKATENFNRKNQLGQGGFGVVYKGVIPGENLAVAVKRFSRDTMQRHFLAELIIISRLRHRNIVPLLGWCHTSEKLLLVYDFMPNGSLDHHLYSEPPAQPLPWHRRQQIITGVASALNYLHNEYDQKVVHCDLKASNILLDENFNGRLGNFLLARAIDNGGTSYDTVEIPGIMGNIAPECFHTGKATSESDVFGFGAVILEVVCGREPRGYIDTFKHLTDWVWNLYANGSILDAVDPRLGEEYHREEAERLLLLGLACSHPNSADRPTTHDVLQIIRGSAPTPEIPPVKPAFVWLSECLGVYEDSNGIEIERFQESEEEDEEEEEKPERE